VYKGAVKNSTRQSLRRLSTFVGAFLIAFVFLVAVFLVVFGGAILDSYGKRKAERAFDEKHPGSVLRIGHLNYSMGANRLVAESVTLKGSNTTIEAQWISLTGVRWVKLLWGTAAPADVLAKASLDAKNLDLKFPRARYGIRCARLRATAPASELVAEGTALRTLVGDEEFFASQHFRTTRFHVVVPECRVSGLVYGELLRGQAYRARSVQFSRPVFEALVNVDKPVEPFVKSPLMVHEALAAIRQPLQVDSLGVTDGCLKYCEQVVAGADTGVLTISAVNISAQGIANRGESSAAIALQAQGKLMDAGLLKVQMSIPIMPADFSLRYSGSLGAMDLTNLDAFLGIDAGTRIKSGIAREATFEIKVTAGQARGNVRGSYHNLEIAIIDKRTGSENRIDDRISSLLANMLKIRSSNDPKLSGLSKVGEVNYTRKQDDEFQQFLWFALRTGVLDIISH
jgi:hypothetical protein